MFTQKNFLLSLIVGLTLINGFTIVSKKNQTLEIDNPAIELNKEFQGNMSVLPSDEPFVITSDSQYGQRNDYYQDNQKSFVIPTEDYKKWESDWETNRMN